MSLSHRRTSQAGCKQDGEDTLRQLTGYIPHFLKSRFPLRNLRYARLPQSMNHPRLTPPSECSCSRTRRLMLPFFLGLFMGLAKEQWNQVECWEGTENLQVEETTSSSSARVYKKCFPQTLNPLSCIDRSRLTAWRYCNWQ